MIHTQDNQDAERNWKGKSETHRPLGRRSYRWKDNIKKDLKKYK
jgi:hypothetical protein